MSKEKEAGSIISFDVLLRGKTDDVSVAPVDLDKLRPPAEAIERCFRWLSEQGVTCHRTDFGLACTAKTELFESLFNVQVSKQNGGVRSSPAIQLHGEPHPPSPIAPLVLQITVARPPTYFD